MLSPLGRQNRKSVGESQTMGSQLPQSLNKDLKVATVSHQPSRTPLLPLVLPTSPLSGQPSPFTATFG